MKHICHYLRGMVNVALKVYKGRLLLQDAILMTLGNGIHHFVHVGVSFANVHIIPDADDIGHEGDHVGCLADRLAVGDLGLALVQILYLKA